MNTVLEQINSAGLRFVEFALPMLVQSGVLILILLLTDFVLRKKVRAVFRYWIWMLVLLKLVLPTSLSTPVSLGYFFGDELAYVNMNRPATEAEPIEPAPAIVPPNINFTNIQADKFTPTPAPTIPATGPVVTEPAQPPAEPVTPLSWQGAIFLLWAAIVPAMGLLLLQRAIFVRGLVAQAKEANDSMADTLESCRERIRVKRKICLKVSANATSPAVCGLFRPVILMPKNLASSLIQGQLRAVLLHELAHIRRGDLWVNLAQTLLQIIYFYNPLLWLANAIIRRIREQAVDEMVLVAMGEKAQQYPQTLVDVAKLAFKRPALSLRLIGVVESKSALAGRIKHILNRPLPKKAKIGILGLAVVIITAAILLPMAAFKPGLPSMVIKGIVKDAQMGEPIAGARVFDDGYGPKPDWEQIKADERSEWGAITNSAGEYSFLTWPEHHSIKVEAPGYESERRSLYSGHFVINKKDEEIFNFALKGLLIKFTELQEGVDEKVSVDDTTIWSKSYEVEFARGEDMLVAAEVYQAGKPMRILGRKIFAGSDKPENLTLTFVRNYEDVAKTSITYNIKFQLGRQVFRIPEFPVYTTRYFSGDLWDWHQGEAPRSLKTRHTNEEYTGIEPLFRYCSWGFERESEDQAEFWIPGSNVTPIMSHHCVVLRMIPLSRLKYLSVEPIGGYQGLDGKIIPSTNFTLEKANEIADAYKKKIGEYIVHQEPNNDFTATLPNGVTVELVGLCEHPSEGKQWWRPDGTEMSKEIRVRTRGGISASGIPYNVAVKVTMPEDATFKWGRIKGETGGISLEAVDSEGRPISNMQALRVYIDEQLTATSIQLGAAAGPWKTRARDNSRGGKSTPGIVFSKAYESDRGVRIIVADEHLDLDYRITAIDTQGKEHVFHQRGGSAGRVRQTTAFFDDIKLNQIEYFLFQTRPYQWVEFKNVSLKPNFKTDVQVEVEGQSSGSNLIEKLQAAIVGGDISKVEKLIGEGVSVNMPGKEGKTPLRWAVDAGHEEIVELLIRNGANVNTPDDYGNTPLHITGTKPQADTAKYLDIAGILIANGADVNAKARSNRTPLHFCAKYGNKDIVELLIASGANIDVKDDFGKTPLLFAECIHKGVSEALINNGADVTAKDKYGQTPLHLAANWGHVDIVKLFLDKEAEVNAKDNNGLTPLDYATKKNYRDAMKLLVANGGYSAYKLENFELKRVFLPDVDDKAVMLDLASGQLVDIPEPVAGLEVLAAIDKLDKGDITYDAGNLIFVRGATSNKSDVQAGLGSVKVYKIIDGWHLPERMIVTTRSGEQYELSIIGANKKGCRINYYYLVKNKLQVESEKPQSLIFHGLDLTAVPHTTNSSKLPDLFEERPPGSKSYRIQEDVTVIYSGIDGTVYFIPGRNIFYVQHDKLGSSTLTYYGPFEGNPVQVLNLQPDVQVEDKPVVGEWEDIGTAIPADFNDTISLAEHITVASIGQDAEGKTFISLLRDREKTKNQQYRFILVRSDGRVVEPAGYKTFVFGDQLGEKFSFNMPYHHNQIKEFRLQRFPLNLERKASLPLVKPYEPHVNGKIAAQATSGPPGRGALHFDGQNDYLDVPHIRSQSMKAPFTVELWIKPEFPKKELENRASWGLIGKGCIGKDWIFGRGKVEMRGFGITLHRFGDDPNLLMVDYNAGRVYTKPYDRRDFDDWMHLYHVFRPDNYTPGHTHPLVIGRFLTSEQPFAGQIGEIRIWAGVRSRDQISEYRNKPLIGDEPDLVACWTFEQSGGQIAYDISANRNHARLGRTIDTDDTDPAWVTVTDLPTTGRTIDEAPGSEIDDQMLARSTVGPVGKHALSFDGVDDYLHVPDNSTLTLKSPFTIEMWLKPDFSELPNEKASEKLWPFLSLLHKGKRLFSQEKRIQAGGFMMFVGPSSQPDWKCSASLYLGNERGQMYQVDGFFGDRLQPAQPGWLYVSTSCTRESYIPIPNQPLMIGQNILQGGFPFKGQIAEIRIWDGIGSCDQIAQYNNKPLNGDEPGLVACWNFNRPGGQVVYDIGPNGNHARLGGSEGSDDADPKWIDLKAASHQPDQKTDVQVEAEMTGAEAGIEERIRTVIDKFWIAVEADDFGRVRQLSQVDMLKKHSALEETLRRFNKERKQLLSRGIDISKIISVHIRGNEAVAVGKANRDRLMWYYLEKSPDGWLIKLFDDAPEERTIEEIFTQSRRHTGKPDVRAEVERSDKSSESKSSKQAVEKLPEMRGRVYGVVVNSVTGEPIAGAYVGVGDFGDSGGSNYSRHRQQGLHAKAQTDEEGRFVLEGVAFRDDHPLVVTHPEFVRHDMKVAVQRGGPEPEIKVSLRPAAKINVTVVDSNGKPLEGFWLIRLEALDRRHFIPPGRDRHLSSFASSIWIELPKPKMKPDKKSLSGTTGFSFTELDSGEYSIDVIKFTITDNYTPPPAGMVRLPLDTSNITYYGGIANLKIETGQMKEVAIKPANYRTSITIKMPDDPVKKPNIPPFVVVSRNVGLLLWNDGKAHGPEDHRLGRLQKNALYYNVVVDGDVLTIKNLPPGSYSVFAGPVYFMNAVRMKVLSGREVTVEIPVIQLGEHAKVGLWTFDRKVKPEAGSYSVSDLCELISAKTGSNPRIIAEASIQNEKLKLSEREMSVWDLLETLYLEKGWKLKEGAKKTLVLYPAAKADVQVGVEKH